MAHDVFISYAHRDKEIADQLLNALESNRISCWIAPRNILPGIDWMDAIMDALIASRCFVLILTESSNKSDQVKREVENAVSEAIPILPFRAENVPLSRHMRYLIGVSHWLDAMDKPLEPHLDKLVETIHVILSRSEENDEVVELNLEGNLVPALEKAGLQKVTIPAGDTLFHQGDVGDALYVLCEGLVDILATTPDSAEPTLVATVKPVAVLGEMSLLLNESRTATIVAREDATLWKVTPTHFAMALSRGEGWAVKLLLRTSQVLARRITMARTPPTPKSVSS